jgi:hypothetical protein
MSVVEDGLPGNSSNCYSAYKAANPPHTFGSSGVYTTTGQSAHSHSVAVSGNVGSGNYPSSTDSRPSFARVNYIIRAY